MPIALDLSHVGAQIAFGTRKSEIVILANLASLAPNAISALENSISALETSISDLESSIASLDKSLRFWEVAGSLGALLVVIGVLLELQDIRHRHGEDVDAWALSYFGLSPSFKRPRFWKRYRVEVASVILVAGGVGVELGAGLMIESKNTELQAIDIELRSKNSALRSQSEQLLALVTQQAGDASSSARKARDAAKEAWQYAVWRKIPDPECNSIKDALEPMHGHTLTVQANPDEAEIWGYANRLNNCFGMKGTATVWPQGWIVAPGLTFSIGKNRQDDFEAIANAMGAAGVESADLLRKHSDHKGVSDNDLIVTVGPRH
jgi:hypothetical protein